MPEESGMDKAGGCVAPATDADTKPVTVVFVVRREWFVGVATRAWHAFRRRGIWIVLLCLLLAVLISGLQRRTPGLGELGVKLPLTATCCVLVSRAHPIAGLVYASFGGLFTDALSPGLPLGLSWVSLFVCGYLFGARGWVPAARFRRAELALSCCLSAMLVALLGIAGATLVGVLDMRLGDIAVRTLSAGLAGGILGALITAVGALVERIRLGIKARRSCNER
jgi:hypothetical protein